jgi:8-oxo-dGTP diphosphatase
MKVRPSVLIIENQKVMLMRYRYGQADVYNLAGGNPDKGETLTQTLVRELREELGIEIEIGAMILSGEVILEEQKNDVLHCVFRAKISAGIPILNPAETSALELAWILIEDLHTIEMYPNIGIDLQKILMKESDYEYIGKISQKWY